MRFELLTDLDALRNGWRWGGVRPASWPEPEPGVPDRPSNLSWARTEPVRSLRELILEGRRHRLIEIRHLEIAGALYLPALIVAILVMGAVHLNPLLAFAVAGVLFMAFFGFVVSFKNG